MYSTYTCTLRYKHFKKYFLLTNLSILSVTDLKLKSKSKKLTKCLKVAIIKNLIKFFKLINKFQTKVIIFLFKS